MRAVSDCGIKGEHIIAEASGRVPSEIWLSRYYDEMGNLIDRQKLMRSHSL
ncbi:hypothetical protein F3J28_12670 [Enterobacter sp. Ap-1006]|uniref:helix-turn-helix domain-containing protein n=1 Tax=Enterobacter sp. Ap-1006 TaxID=2608345 RepID=UPI001423EA63|nr:hypothetical protein [Enterobacter sp. Ap-1006]